MKNIYELQTFQDDNRRTVVKRTQMMTEDGKVSPPTFSGRGTIRSPKGDSIDIEFRLDAQRLDEAYEVFDVCAQAAVAELSQKAKSQQKRNGRIA
jgi:hypothetical protein